MVMRKLAADQETESEDGLVYFLRVVMSKAICLFCTRLVESTMFPTLKRGLSSHCVTINHSLSFLLGEGNMWKGKLFCCFRCYA